MTTFLKQFQALPATLPWLRAVLTPSSFQFSELARIRAMLFDLATGYACICVEEHLLILLDRHILLLSPFAPPTANLLQLLGDIGQDQFIFLSSLQFSAQVLEQTPRKQLLLRTASQVFSLPAKHWLSIQLHMVQQSQCRTGKDAKFISINLTKFFDRTVTQFKPIKMSSVIKPRRRKQRRKLMDYGQVLKMSTNPKDRHHHGNKTEANITAALDAEDFLLSTRGGTTSPAQLQLSRTISSPSGLANVLRRLQLAESAGTTINSAEKKLIDRAHHHIEMRISEFLSLALFCYEPDPSSAEALYQYAFRGADGQYGKGSLRIRGQRPETQGAHSAVFAGVTRTIIGGDGAVEQFPLHALHLGRTLNLTNELPESFNATDSDMDFKLRDVRGQAIALINQMAKGVQTPFALVKQFIQIHINELAELEKKYVLTPNNPKLQVALIYKERCKAVLNDYADWFTKQVHGELASTSAHRATLQSQNFGQLPPHSQKAIYKTIRKDISERMIVDIEQIADHLIKHSPTKSSPPRQQVIEHGRESLQQNAKTYRLIKQDPRHVERLAARDMRNLFLGQRIVFRAAGNISASELFNQIAALFQRYPTATHLRLEISGRLFKAALASLASFNHLRHVDFSGVRGAMASIAKASLPASLNPRKLLPQLTSMVVRPDQKFTSGAETVMPFFVTVKELTIRAPSYAERGRFFPSDDLEDAATILFNFNSSAFKYLKKIVISDVRLSSTFFNALPNNIGTLDLANAYISYDDAQRCKDITVENLILSDSSYDMAAKFAVLNKYDFHGWAKSELPIIDTAPILSVSGNRLNNDDWFNLLLNRVADLHEFYGDETTFWETKYFHSLEVFKPYAKTLRVLDLSDDTCNCSTANKRLSLKGAEKLQALEKLHLRGIAQLKFRDLKRLIKLPKLQYLDLRGDSTRQYQFTQQDISRFLFLVRVYRHMMKSDCPLTVVALNGQKLSLETVVMPHYLEQPPRKKGISPLVDEDSDLSEQLGALSFN